MNTTYQKAREFIYRNARPLDLARWQFHFENGSQEAVLNALSYYQNEDGGFGHALEADAWNPNSSPIQTWTATEILREINFTDPSHPLIKGILHYLGSSQDFEGKFWYKIIKSNNDFPHAPWWHTEMDSTGPNDYNPTACLAGFIIRFSEPNSALYKLGCRIAKEAFDKLMLTECEERMHTITCYIQLLQYLEDSNTTTLIDLASFKVKLSELVKNCLTQDKTKWETSYICKPSQFFSSPSSIFYAENKALADYEAEFIIKTQLDDGSWNITWGWSDYPSQWAISKNWWKASGIISNLLYLRGFDKL